jgi:hypothetical protein
MLSLTGYLHPGYARSLSEFGSPTELPRSGGWFLKRNVPGYEAFDGIGCYPFLACQDWSALAADLEALSNDMVSFAAVLDPFGHYTLADLRSIFPEKAILFKDHYVADLTQPPHKIMSSHHRKGAEKVLREVEVEFHPQPIAYIEEWLRLFEFSVQRFNITGIRAYSRESLRQQLVIPGTFLSIARYKSEAVSAHIWFVHGDTAYSHLAAASEKARALSADYALYHEEIRFFAGRVHWVSWGGEAGAAANSLGKLGCFKRGWSTTTRPVYFCGRIFNQEKYNHITDAEGGHARDYFPAYREGEYS